jgi:hypothetical protein
MQVQADRTAVIAGSMANRPKTIRGKTVLVTLDHLDGRTIASKRARDLAAAYEAALGPGITETQRQAARTAGMLVAMAEDATARRLAGDTAISIDDVVRAQGCADRAVKRLGLDRKREAKPGNGTLGAILRGDHG